MLTRLTEPSLDGGKGQIKRRGEVNAIVDIILYIFLGLIALVTISFLFKPSGRGGGSDRGGFDRDA